MKEVHRSGGKFQGRHTTFLEIGARIADRLVEDPLFDKIISGYIRPHRGKGRSSHRVVVVTDQHSIKMIVHQGAVSQEIYVMSQRIAEAKERVRTIAEMLGYHISVR